ncbi:YslB family protein [Mammaliicoccus sciuri]|uniref:YslB like protein n=1 Tax=Sporosarcina newyorkensis 2681 TaxID=1027292 RepID=F9DVS7_9BACL|nr:MULTISPECIES: YslB family protein [Sporosarcina]EGQ22401.1 YslB like protein [Sporosarcina newyorkensis 2681]
MNTQQTPATNFGYNLLRDHLLPTLLGKHEDDILYWLGKDMARKFPILSLDELPAFFAEAGWGQLAIEKTVKQETHYTLHNSSLLELSGGSCSLEAGFLAEQHQKVNGYLTECYGQKMPKEDHIHFIVKGDPKSPV